MKCPYCGEEMVRGYLESGLRHPLVWNSTKPTKGFPFNGNDIPLCGIFKGHQVDMYHCEGCRKFLLDEDDIKV